MTYYVHVIDEQGNYELIDGDFTAIYPNLDFETMPKLTDKQYQAYLARANGKERFVNGKFVYEQIKVDLQAVRYEEIARVREQINTLRDNKSAGGVYVEQLGKWFDSDSKAQSKLLGLKATMDLIGAEMTVDWTCADNTDFKGFGKPQLTAVIATILQAENHNHTVARQHKAALEQAENPLEYDYSGGWSKTYEEFLNEQN